MNRKGSKFKIKSSDISEIKSTVNSAHPGLKKFDMKYSHLILIISSLFVILDAASIEPQRINLDENELKGLNDEKIGDDLKEWVDEKGNDDSGSTSRASPTTTSPSESNASLSDSVIFSSNSITTPASTSTASLADSGNCSGSESPDSSLKESSMSASTIDSNSPEIKMKKVSFNDTVISKTFSSPPEFDFDILISLGDALHGKDFKLVSKLMSQIPDLKITYPRSNFSALSLISKWARNRAQGKLGLSDPLAFFSAFVNGTHRKLAAGYFLALNLFQPKIQCEVISKIIENASHLRGIILINSIYYKLDESVIQLLLDSGAILNFKESPDNYPFGSLPSFSKAKGDIEFQNPTSESLFLNFRENFSSYKSWSSSCSKDNEVNFLYGMMESISQPLEIGTFKVAFENYKPEIVMALINNCPSPAMVNYHLAHLLANNPEKQVGYPKIESLVDSHLVFDRLSNGFADLIALAYLSKLSSSDQVSMISEFLSKTKIFEPLNLDNPRTITTKSDPRFVNETGLYELPISSADVFLLTACKSNISNEAFSLIWDICKGVRSGPFLIVKKKALEIATTKNMTGKINIMSA